MWKIFVDGDNVPVQRYISHIQKTVHEITKDKTIQPIIFCQSNLVFKYQSNLEFNVSFKCCKTTNKNATDTRIIFEIGKSIERGEKVVVVSNDNIFKELESENIVIVKYEVIKQAKLKKNVIVKIVKDFKESQPAHEAIYITDILEYFPSYKIERVRNYIKSIPELEVNQNDGVYFRKNHP